MRALLIGRPELPVGITPEAADDSCVVVDASTPVPINGEGVDAGAKAGLMETTPGTSESDIIGVDNAAPGNVSLIDVLAGIAPIKLLDESLPGVEIGPAANTSVDDAATGVVVASAVVVEFIVAMASVHTVLVVDDRGSSVQRGSSLAPITISESSEHCRTYHFQQRRL